jgi:5-methylcytosine-specific restriction endonuclease McrA
MKCGRCGSELPVNTGRGRPRMYCSSCADEIRKSKRYVTALRKTVRTCEACGRQYNPYREVQRYCSTDCSQPIVLAKQRAKFGIVGKRGRPSYRSWKRRAIRFGVEVENVNRWKVFERDGWKCGVCGEMVDKSIAWPDPFSASLDHIIPMSKGGGHVFDNVQCAHLRCNILKSDKLAA